MYDDVIPEEMWVFFPAATQEELNKYKIWCIETLHYTPYIDMNLILFKSKNDTILFKLSFPNLL